MYFVRHCAKGFVFRLAGAFFLIASPVSSAPTCVTYQGHVSAASRAGNAEKAAELFRRAQQATACIGLAHKRLGRRVAHAYYRKALRKGLSAKQQARLLETGLKYGRPWRLLAMRGDISRLRKQYTRATRLYSEALDDINDKNLNPKAPPPELIAQIHKRAQAVRMLASNYIAHKNRSGEPGGLAVSRFRGFEPKKTAVPVTFKTDSTALTDKGFAAVRDMLSYLKQQGSPAISLIGHTDERGSTVYNQKLSQRRAGAVRDWLLKGGYHGRIRIAGRGESEPFQTDDRGSYTQKERWQLDRRVELVR